MLYVTAPSLVAGGSRDYGASYRAVWASILPRSFRHTEVPCSPRRTVTRHPGTGYSRSTYSTIFVVQQEKMKAKATSKSPVITRPSIAQWKISALIIRHINSIERDTYVNVCLVLSICQ
jgi:hypothetical protein